MPAMSTLEQAFCRSPLWRWFTRRAIFPWALDGIDLGGEVLELGSGSGAIAEELLGRFPPATTTAVMAASQRPSTVASGMEPSGDPAGKTIPSWYLVAKNDQTIPPDAERYMARRAGSQTVGIDSSHVAMMSNPDRVTDLIRAAADTIR
jgi:pimeloyl-ACP methyl ester carboxylesterase